MEIEQRKELFERIYPRIAFIQLADMKDSNVTIVGSVQEETKNGSLVIDCGNNQSFVVVDNFRKEDLDQTTKFVEVRGIVINQKSIKADEVTPLFHESKINFDFETYHKMIGLIQNPQFSSLFY